MKNDLGRLVSRVTPHFGKALLLVVGFVLGAVVFALCSAPPSDAVPVEAADEKAQSAVWTCSMHPQVRQPEAGQCPLCGMDLIPLTSDGQNATLGSNRLVLSERAKALAKLRTVTVRRQSEVSAQLRLLGRIEPDETTRKTVTAWIGGRIDRLHVSTTGARVRSGEVIATLYSPEVFAAHQDLLVAKRQVERMTQSPDAVRAAAQSALEASRNRLRLLGLPDAELQGMETQAQPTRAVAIRSPYSGTVLERLATEGSYIATGTPLYRIANLNKLWLQLDAYESDLARVEVGQTVSVTVEALAGEDFEGTVAFIEPTLDPARRTAQVRVELDNRDGRLRPGMFAEATVATTAQGGQSKPSTTPERGPLLVPATAPLFTGRRALVYVEVQGVDKLEYEARPVRLGPRLGDFYPVVAGLSEGERVVVRGAFAIDADLQIRGGASMMTLPDDSVAGQWDTALDMSDAGRAMFSPVIEGYLAVQAALASDDLTRARASAAQFVGAVKAVAPKQSEVANAWLALLTDLQPPGATLAKAIDIEEARAAFENLSGGIEKLVRRFGNPLDEPLNVAFCPMAFGSRGATWIQRGNTIDNAYFGASMRTCGELQHEVKPGDYLESPVLRPGERSANTAVEHQH